MYRRVQLHSKTLRRSSADRKTTILVRFTDSTVQRPFWIFGHNPNSVAITEQYINMGVNALEPDVEYFSSLKDDPVTKGFYIAHQLDSSFIACWGVVHSARGRDRTMLIIKVRHTGWKPVLRIANVLELWFEETTEQ